MGIVTARVAAALRGQTPAEAYPQATPQAISRASAQAPAPPQTPPSNNDLTGPRRPTVIVPKIFDLTIMWNVHAKNPIWRNEEEKMLALGPANLPTNLKNSFWKHPVRYLEVVTPNIFRTVMIDYIPTEATYKDVLDQIYGGSLEQIQLVGPLGNTTNFMTARVVFNYEQSASIFHNHAQDHPVEVKGQPVRVWQLLQQTYPKNKQLDEDVFDSCYTRILVIKGASPQQMKAMPEKLGHLEKAVVEYGMTYDHLPQIEFTSVAAASQALSILMSDRDFGSAEFDFDQDPCDAPVPAR